MDAIAKTAYYCCGVRAADAASAKPVCGDHLAQRFMSNEAKDVFRNFEDLNEANRSNAARHRIIDDLLKSRLAADRNLRVIILGAGFDTRACRLDGGRWLELDQPALIAVKNEALPTSEAPNPLVRLGIDFARDSLARALQPFAEDKPTVVVMEGVSMYLDEATLKASLETLRRIFPRHTLICDLMTAGFVRRYSAAIRQRIVALGGEFAPPVVDPSGAIIAAGYVQVDRISIVGRARELGALKVPRFLLNTFLRSLRDGYCVYVFETKA